MKKKLNQKKQHDPCATFSNRVFPEKFPTKYGIEPYFLFLEIIINALTFRWHEAIFLLNSFYW